MLKLLNDTKYTANLYPGYNKNNEHQLTCVIKAGYNFDSCGNLKLFDIPPQIEIEDNFIGDVNKSSLSSTSDIMPYKYKSEILIYGTAQIDKKKYLSSVKVQIKRENNTWEKSLCIFGVRFWRKVLFWVFPGRPSDLKPTPIIYEYAFGGEGYEKNPAGIGYSEKLFNKKNIPMPQIEEFSKVTENTKNMPSAGFTPIPHYWTLIKKHLPLPNVYSMAPKDQQFDKPFFGNEIISIQGMIEGIDTNEKVRYNSAQSEI